MNKTTNKKWLVFYLFFFPLSCENPEILSGLWKGETAIKIETEKEELDFYPVLVLGHFGPEVAGVIWFYKDINYTLLPEAQKEKICPCRHLEKGNFSKNEFTFSFKSPYLCKEESSYISAKLIYYSSSDSIKGEFLMNNKNIGNISFDRKKEKEDITSEKECNY